MNGMHRLGGKLICYTQIDLLHTSICYTQFDLLHTDWSVTHIDLIHSLICSSRLFCYTQIYMFTHILIRCTHIDLLHTDWSVTHRVICSTQIDLLHKDWSVTHIDLLNTSKCYDSLNGAPINIFLWGCSLEGLQTPPNNFTSRKLKEKPDKRWHVAYYLSNSSETHGWMVFQRCNGWHWLVPQFRSPPPLTEIS